MAPIALPQPAIQAFNNMLSLLDRSSSSATMAHFEKRDNMGYAIHPSLIVLLIMLGAALLVAMLAGMIRMYFPAEEGMTFPSNEQMEYMREVRERNLADLMATGRSTGKNRH
ncbi:hypothetical protein BDV96DRAFT_642099 [Lophiotrema nucula]|uniref:Uncharacterized protein n=1 Tax=Lophiotrema nucula TaxID=690887 RepID=A0A6A5ZM63_9PLEO|nr:hypothetical protein BDV96DRAFT_642099 [Lophiotrema nucula]